MMITTHSFACSSFMFLSLQLMSGLGESKTNFQFIPQEKCENKPTTKGATTFVGVGEGQQGACSFWLYLCHSDISKYYLLSRQHNLSGIITEHNCERCVTVFVQRKHGMLYDPGIHSRRSWGCRDPLLWSQKRCWRVARNLGRKMKLSIFVGRKVEKSRYSKLRQKL